uniref:Transposase, MuDR, MULE transposase domain protein n=1 Tax=Tanacetum cinerariifolium TaxID=118510 RepID=A0A6L2L0B1_TANCI|nr:transposase, MuDR, MULE transposase domain protein [Tanacetum cinerariifolium]
MAASSSTQLKLMKLVKHDVEKDSVMEKKLRDVCLELIELYKNRPKEIQELQKRTGDPFTEGAARTLKKVQGRDWERITGLHIMMAPRTDHLVFKFNYDDVFLEEPLRLEDNICALFYCVPKCSLGEGFTIVESNGDMNKMYEIADLYGLIELYITHIPQNLALWYYKNLCLDGSDEEATLKRKIHEIRLKDVVRKVLFEELKGKVLFEDFIHTDYVVDEGVGYNGVTSEGVGYDGDTVQAVGNDGLGDGVAEEVVTDNIIAADNGVLDVGGSRIPDVGGSSLLGLASSRLLAETRSSVQAIGGIGGYYVVQTKGERRVNFTTKT